MAIVRVKIDPANLPKPDPKDLARFDAIRDEDIDYSDIPDMGDVSWDKAIPFDEFMRELNAPKKSVTIRFDSKVINWFKANSGKNGKSGRGYQTAMNAVLREFVEMQNKKSD